jgi:DNA invertase Pin-like site-specific DNA recombinase
MTIYGYLRVSTVKQEESNFKASIIELAQSKGLYEKIVWISETVSGRKDWRNRLLGQEFEKMKNGDIIIMAEYSRIGRNFLQSMEFIAECRRKGITVYSTIGDIPLKDDANSNLFLALTAWKSQTERENLAYRTKVGLQVAKSKGIKLGRPKKMKLDKDINNERLILNDLKLGCTKRSICRRYKITAPTLDKYLKSKGITKDNIKSEEIVIKDEKIK